MAEAERRGLQAHARWSLALRWGFSSGEALGLKWEDIDLVSGLVTIRRQLQFFAGEGMKGVMPKSDARVRWLLLDQGTLALLDSLWRERLKTRLAADDWEDQHPAHRSQKGGSRPRTHCVMI